MMITKEAAIREPSRISSRFFLFLHPPLLSTNTIVQILSDGSGSGLNYLIYTQKCRLDYKRAKYLRET